MLVDVQAELASTKETLEEAQSAITQWTEYSTGLSEEKTTLEGELSALKEQLADAQSSAAATAAADAVTCDAAACARSSCARTHDWYNI